MSQPIFSIAIGNYNHGHYLSQCLAGIARQTFCDYEVLITDDGSTDGSQAIIAKAAADDIRIKPNYFAKNQGALAAMKDVYARASGKYTFGEGADDFILNERFLELAAAGLKEHPYAAGFFGVAGLLSAEKNELAGKFGTGRREGYITPEECYRDILRGIMFLPGSSSIWRRDLIAEIGGFDFSLGPQTDFLINHALPARYGVVYTNTPVTCQRIYQTSTNYGSKGGTLWEATDRLMRVEKRMREWALPYGGMDDDWKVWRARYTLEAIRTTGVTLV